jgi:hypothetical protein
MRINLTSGAVSSPDEAVLAAELAKAKRSAEARAWSGPSRGSQQQQRGNRPERTEEEKADHRENRQLETTEVLARLKLELPEVWKIAEVVGAWVWITFPMKPTEEVRKAIYRLGFEYHFKRKAWFHKGNSFNQTIPRQQHGSVSAQEFEQEPQPGPSSGKPLIILPTTRWSPAR